MTALERADGRVRLDVGSRDGISAVAGLRQSGCGRLLFPARRRDDPLEAVIVNTAGGLTGGDRFTVEVEAAAGTAAVVTTQACERLYRSSGSVATVETRLVVGKGARLAWLPQETILFDRSKLERRLDVTVDPSAVLTLVESVILGRAASGERLGAITLRDRWRVRRGGRLIFAEETRLGDELAAALANPATLNGAATYATILHVAPEAPALVDEARAIAGIAGCDVGVGALDGFVIARLVAPDGARLRAALLPLIRHFAGQVPRVWSL